MNVRDCTKFDITSLGAVINSFSGAGTINSDPLDLGNFTEGIVFINSTAHSGTTPTLDCKIQYGVKNADGSYSWVDSGDSFTQITTTNGLFFKKLSSIFGRYIRLVFTIAGTNPTYTATPVLVAKS